MEKIQGRNRIFEINTFGQDVSVTVTPITPADNLMEYRITVDFAAPAVPGRIFIRWLEPFVDMLSTWTPNNRDRALYADWRPMRNYSRSAAGAPLLSLVGRDGTNSCTLALSDAATPTMLSAGISERCGDCYCVLELFINRMDVLQHYEATLRIDSRPIPFYESIFDVREFWTAHGYPNAYVPCDARRAMFSTWYNFQKEITAEGILHQCKLAKTYGMDTVIVDDGWQTAEFATGGYSYCGDWKAAPSKFPDMKGFVDSLHEMGMKCILWYSVPFVGVYTDAYKEFEGMYLWSRDGGKTSVLDPRFAKTRAYLVSIYESAVRGWGLDGLKLDFIDCFSLREESPQNYADMDCVSLEVAVEKLLCEITERLYAINPDILLEFRQSYIGPVMQKYGNILRVGDCVGGATINRLSSMDLRLVSGNKTAVHSDMILWNYDAPVETAADQLVNVLFCTPQISVLFDRLPDSHQQMLRYYLDFIEENRPVLLDGRLTLKGVEGGYSQIVATREGKTVAALYTNPVYQLADPCHTLILANGHGSATLYVENKVDPARYAFVTCNCMGEQTDSGMLTMEQGSVTPFTVPVCGFVTLTRI